MSQLQQASEPEALVQKPAQGEDGSPNGSDVGAFETLTEVGAKVGASAQLSKGQTGV